MPVRLVCLCLSTCCRRLAGTGRSFTAGRQNSLDFCPDWCRPTGRILKHRTPSKYRRTDRSPTFQAGLILIPDFVIPARHSVERGLSQDRRLDSHSAPIWSLVASVCLRCSLAGCQWTFGRPGRNHPLGLLRYAGPSIPTGTGVRQPGFGSQRYRASGCHRGRCFGMGDMLLYLIGRLASPEEALRIAKLYLLQWHGRGATALLHRCRPDAAMTTG